MDVTQGYCFDDVLLIPKYSDIKNRSSVDLSVDLGKGIKLSIPIVSANMKHVSELGMAKALSRLGGMCLLHRFCSIEQQLQMFKECDSNFVGISVGVQEIDKDNLKQLVEVGAKIVCVDVAHAHHQLCLDMVSYIRKTYPDILLIAGNVATAQGAKALSRAGADVIKIGIGSGSICSTRIETGNGVPQLSALDEAYRVSRRFGDQGWIRKFKIISDGGARQAGDLCKALCFSDVVMLGNLLAGTDEAPGQTIVIDGESYKEYAGSSTFKTNHVEGVSGLVKTKGSVVSIIEKLMEGLKSGCSYQGVSNLMDLKKNPQFVAISNSGLRESHPHSITIRK